MQRDFNRCFLCVKDKTYAVKHKTGCEDRSQAAIKRQGLASVSNQNTQEAFDTSNASDRKKSLKISSDF